MNQEVKTSNSANFENQLNSELADVLMSISVIAKQLSKKLGLITEDEQLLKEGTDQLSMKEALPKSLTLEEVRAILADKSRQGFTEDIRYLLEKYGANKLTSLDPTNYSSLLQDVKSLGNK